jgi:hypothetical protein
MTQADDRRGRIEPDRPTRRDTGRQRAHSFQNDRAQRVEPCFLFGIASHQRSEGRGVGAQRGNTAIVGREVIGVARDHVPTLARFGVLQRREHRLRAVDDVARVGDQRATLAGATDAVEGRGAQEEHDDRGTKGKNASPPRCRVIQRAAPHRL